MNVDILLTNISLLNDSGTIEHDKALGIQDGTIILCDNTANSLTCSAKEVINLEGHLITPGLIDAHTHLVYAGDRMHEFALRRQGVSYETIAAQGGGIQNTVQKTREASEQQLFDESFPRILSLKNDGVTTVEIKSGYGLDLESELKMLRVARLLGEKSGLRVKTTFLGAHSIPQEYKTRPDAYVDYLINEMLPEVAASKLADAVDVFCESIAFNIKQTERIFDKAVMLNLPVKCHAEQLSNIGASVLASRYKLLSCDHLEHIDEKGVKALKSASATAVLLPGAFYMMREEKKPPIVLFREYGVPMVIATDCNPGTSPTTSLTLMMSMGCQLFGMTLEEVWQGVTAHAAKALGIENETGSLAIGKKADLLCWGLSDPAAVCYYFGVSQPHRMMREGRWI